MVISHNLLAMNAQRQFNITGNQRKKSTEKLASGYRINRSADDAAGLAISEKMRRQIKGLTQGTRNAQDGISMCQIADGALNEVSDMMHRLTELSVQSANGTNDAQDRQAIQQEVNALVREIDRVCDTTTFNEQKIFSDESNYYSAISGLDYDAAKIQLLNGGYIHPVDSIVLDTGNILPKEDAEAIVSTLSSLAIAGSAVNAYDIKVANDGTKLEGLLEARKIIEDKIFILADNAKAGYQYAASPSYEYCMTEAANNIDRHYNQQPRYIDDAKTWYGSACQAERRAGADTPAFSMAEGMFYALDYISSNNYSESSYVQRNRYIQYDFSTSIKCILDKNGITSGSLTTD